MFRVCDLSSRPYYLRFIVSCFVTDLNMLRVNESRLKLHEKGLNVDGSREAMIAALKSLSPQG